MKKIIIIFAALSLMLTGCGKVHDPSSATTETVNTTEDVYKEAEVKEATYNMDANLINYQQEENKHTYTIFTCANDAYAVLAEDCVHYLTEDYQKIQDVVEGISVQVWNINKTSTKETAAFIQIVSPQILDTQKLFVYAFGTTDYQEGMAFESVDEYKTNYEIII